tara:strand:+ start:243 stop:626 length:384 start_codon:yes stop_codon:yes gene_type:complete
MALPALGVAARLILSSGGREAAKKYGKAAVKKAQEQIKKFNEVADQKARQATIELGKTPAKAADQAARARARTQSSREGLRTRLERQRTGRERSEGNLIPEVPLKFATGGSIDGIAIKGLTKGSNRR